MSDDPRWEPFCLLPRELTPGQRQRAVRVVAAHAENADDLRALLEMLGLAAADSRPQPVSDEDHAAAAPPGWLADLARLRRQLSNPH
ncbi:MAG TPA: hypothetical protein VHF06_10615 [Pseudonocardiaceae bacterium]|jgi:hypothetical protein|nr:hypothetical protein [Pseudonocardiaceae bacterium]